MARSAEGVHPVIGLWPIGIAGKLEAALDRGQRKASAWAEQQGAVEVFFPPTQLGGRAIDPFFNINRPENLAEANALLASGRQAQGLMRLIFEPSSVRLYIRPFWSRMKPITGLTTLSVSIEPPMPTVMMATEPSTPTFHPALSSNPRRASSGHEHDDDRPLLHAELKAERGRDQIVVAHDPLLIEQDSLAIFAAKANPRLDHGGKHQNADGLVGKLAGALKLADKAM